MLEYSQELNISKENKNKNETKLTKKASPYIYCLKQ